MKRASGSFERRTVDELAIDDERSFRHVAVYPDLKEVLRRAAYPFRVLSKTSAGRADRALLLNLTYFSPDAGGDVLPDARLAADVVAHAAWHHVAARALAPDGGPASADALFLGEAIASAFDAYMVGRLLGRAPRSTFLATQVPAMAETAQAAGLSARAFESLLGAMAADPERAFEDLRALLFDATSALFASRSADAAQAALQKLEDRPMAALLHRYEISNWVLYARAYGSREGERRDARVRAADRALRRAASPIAWLASNWVAPALVSGGRAARGRGR